MQCLSGGALQNGQGLGRSGRERAAMSHTSGPVGDERVWAGCGSGRVGQTKHTALSPVDSGVLLNFRSSRTLLSPLPHASPMMCRALPSHSSLALMARLMDVDRTS